MDGAEQEQQELLGEHNAQLAEVIGTLEDLIESLRHEGANTEAFDRLLADLQHILATTGALKF
jgi:hypothetical protein